MVTIPNSDGLRSILVTSTPDGVRAPVVRDFGSQTALDVVIILQEYTGELFYVGTIISLKDLKTKYNAKANVRAWKDIK